MGRRMHAPALVSSAYMGLLDRPADEGALERYTELVRSDQDGVTVFLRALRDSDEFRRLALATTAPHIVQEIFRALLGRDAEAAAVDAYAGRVADLGTLRQVLSEIGESKEHRTRLLDSSVEWLFAMIFRGLTGHAPEALPGEDRAALTAVAKGGRIDQLVARIATLAPVQEASFASFKVDIVRGIHAGATRKAPSPEELQNAMSALATPADIGALADRCAQARVRQETRPPDVPTTMLDNGIRVVRCDKLADAQSVQLIDGFFDNEAGFVWSKRTSSLVLTGRVTLYVSCNYLFPGEQREVNVESEGATTTITLTDAYAAHEITAGGDSPVFIRFRADGAMSPKDRGVSNDGRALSFQLWLKAPPLPIVHQPLRLSCLKPARKIYCVSDSKKEEDSLKAILPGLMRRGLECESVATSQLGRRFRGRGVDKRVFLIASAQAYASIRNAGLDGTFIYAEHGASPLKGYTYSGHYTRYDLALLPGRLWTERLKVLYPQAATQYEAVGYPKHAVPALSPERREETCARLGLDGKQPIILFAPTWSGGDRACGLFNIRHLNPTGNMFAVPHDGDVKFADELATHGAHIHVLQAGESISDYYALADILVSDVSSTAVEFAALGKPVVCLSMARIPDFEARFHEGPMRIRIPHTGQYWDFCSVVDSASLQAKVDEVAVRVRQGESFAPSDALKELLLCHGDEAAERAADAIQSFLRRDTPHADGPAVTFTAAGT